jgi:hypothetical protein
MRQKKLGTTLSFYLRKTSFLFFLTLMPAKFANTNLLFAVSIAAASCDTAIQKMNFFSNMEIMKIAAPIVSFLLAAPLSANHPQGKPASFMLRDWKMTFSEGMGYRRDRQKLISAYDHSTYRYRDIDTITAVGCLTWSWERLLLRFSGSYGWLVKGNLDMQGLSSPFLAPAQHFQTLKMGSGYSLDIDGALGCRIKFWQFNNGSFSFIPALGYLYSHFNAYPRSQSRSQEISGDTSGWVSFEMIRPVQQDWFGSYAEGRIAFSWREIWRLDFYYQYIPIDFRQTLQESIGNYFFNSSGTLTTASLSTERASAHSHTTRSQVGGAELSYRSPNHWQLGTQFKGACTWSNTNHNIVHVKTDALLPSSGYTTSHAKRNLSVHWVRYDASFFCSYWF